MIEMNIEPSGNITAWKVLISGLNV